MTEIPPTLLQVVLSDANVLYSRVLRDYLLYAAEYQLIAVAWSQTILDEMADHLIANLPDFTEDSARRLRVALAKTFPYAQRDPGPEDFEPLARFTLPDEDDRHVFAAAIAANASIICTSNIADFPPEVAQHLGFTVMTPDDLFCTLIKRDPVTMCLVHATSVANLPRSSDASTINALRRAGAPKSADIMAVLLGLN